MKKFLYNLEAKFRHFMYGRYGMDRLYRGLLLIYLAIYLIAVILGKIFDNRIYVVLSLSAFSLVIFAFYRVFSKNIEKRNNENAKWLIIENEIKKQFRLLGKMWKFRKTHIFKRCPSCKTVLRLKRIKGTHRVTCPHCKESFNIKVIF